MMIMGKLGVVDVVVVGKEVWKKVEDEVLKWLDVVVVVEVLGDGFKGVLKVVGGL